MDIFNKGEGVGWGLSNRETEVRVCELSGWRNWRMGDPWRILVGLGCFGGGRMEDGGWMKVRWFCLVPNPDMEERDGDMVLQMRIVGEEGES